MGLGLYGGSPYGFLGLKPGRGGRGLLNSGFGVGVGFGFGGTGVATGGYTLQYPFTYLHVHPPPTSGGVQFWSLAGSLRYTSGGVGGGPVGGPSGSKSRGGSGGGFCSAKVE